VIHQNGGAIILTLDEQERSYFMRSTDRMRGTIATFNAPWQRDAHDIAVKLRRDGATQVIAGQPAERFLLDVSYTIWMLVEDTAMKARVKARAELWLSDVERNRALPFGFHYAMKTGFPEVDRQISRALLGRGIPLRQTVTASRSIDGEPPIDETMTMEVDSLTVTEIPKNRFRVGHAYRYEEPSVTFPERSE
jgi:hypothetical protein